MVWILYKRSDQLLEKKKIYTPSNQKTQIQMTGLKKKEHGT